MIDLIFDFQMNTILNEQSKKYHSLARVHLNFFTVYFLRFSIAGLWAIELIKWQKSFQVCRKKWKKSLFWWLADKEKISEYLPRNLQFLATQIYRVRDDLRSEILKDISHFVQKPYNLKNHSTLQKQKTPQCSSEQKAYFLLSPKHRN